MIETDIFWPQKTFESVLTDLWKMWKEGIDELENTSIYCTENSEINNETDGVQVIDLCSLSQTKNNERCKGKESAKQESQDKTKTDAINRMEDGKRPRKRKPMTKNGEVETVIRIKSLARDQRTKKKNRQKERKIKT